MVFGIGLGALASSGGVVSNPWLTWTGANNGSPSNIDTSSTNPDEFVSTTFATDASMVIYFDDSTQQLASRVITTTGVTIAYGTIFNITSATSVNSLSCTTLDTSRVLACWAENAASLKACVLSVSGATITKGATASFAIPGGGTPTGISVTKIVTDVSILAYSDGGTANARSGCVVSTSTTTATINTRTIFGTHTTSAGSIVPLTSSSAIYTYTDTTAFTVIGTVLTASGTTISAGTEVVIYTEGGTAALSNVASCALSSTKIVTLFKGAPAGSSSNQLLAIASTVGATSITSSGSAVQFGSTSTNVSVNKGFQGGIADGGCLTIDGTTFMAFMCTGSGTTTNTAGITASVAGNVITQAATVGISSNQSSCHALSLLSSTRILAIYDQASHSNIAEVFST